MPVYRSERLFQLINGLFFILVAVAMLAPLVHLAAISLSSADFSNAHKVYFWPRGFNLNVYQDVFQQSRLWRAMGVSVYITVFGTLISLYITSALGYALTRPKMRGRKVILRALIVTFIFSIPLIPFYLVVRTVGMENSLWALMIPGALSVFNTLIVKTFFQGISSELFDAAQIDGCSEYGMFFRIAVPMSLPAIATIGLFHAVDQWNSYFYALIFLHSKAKYPIQVILKSMVMDGSSGVESDSLVLFYSPEQLKAGIVLFATIPILIVYPFLQKYFVKGAMLGSLKE
ncbi:MULTISPECIES: carbohydrate ABC transporter permease [unclassified Paenibacillus]|uniref:carbohydrate ABC transporter permease n=1 Tax=unclassified Paenibacillus TaxID=185978 RepID=UPI00070DD04C|nr:MULTISPECIES: carbohydrate ABC transporter permease [unclassified Paenibacillus]KQX48826.1 hypothetical protein ASD40_11735 [Paenibacillus sp. Root444D2]KRE36444.1 hypothetical protein ASG85_09760 [Paenibacillus sp. Soil724D2]